MKLFTPWATYEQAQPAIGCVIGIVTGSCQEPLPTHVNAGLTIASFAASFIPGGGLGVAAVPYDAAELQAELAKLNGFSGQPGDVAKVDWRKLLALILAFIQTIVVEPKP